MSSNNTISLYIRDTENVLFDGKVDRISSYNEVGPFDVYPMHANFISIIHKSISVYSSGKLVKHFDIDQSILKVKHDQVNVFLGIESLLLREEKEMRRVTKS